MKTPSTLPRATWRDLHLQALSEQDDRKGLPRIAEAYKSIMDRMLSYSMGLGMEETLANAEYKQLIDALDDLRKLRKPQGRSTVSL